MNVREPLSDLYDADISTEFGTFRLRMNKITFPNKFDNEITLNIGGKDDCASFTIPMYNKKPIKLSYANASSDRFQCTLDDKEIKGESTFKMMCLAFTIIREITDQTYIEFHDMSHFECLLPNGEKKDVELAPFSFLFYGQTWYEQKFGAVLVDISKRNAYTNMKCRRNDPAYKPDVYMFGNNKSLQLILQPHFEATSTWAEFFKRISDEFGKKKCSLVYPWVSDVLQRHIFKNNFVFSGDEWIMNIKTMPNIPYTIKHIYSDGRQIGGGGINIPMHVANKHFERYINHNKYVDLDYTIFGNRNRSKTIRPTNIKNGQYGPA